VLLDASMVHSVVEMPWAPLGGFWQLKAPAPNNFHIPDLAQIRALP